MRLKRIIFTNREASPLPFEVTPSFKELRFYVYLAEYLLSVLFLRSQEQPDTSNTNNPSRLL
jgi:hypothetical protein